MGTGGEVKQGNGVQLAIECWDHIIPTGDKAVFCELKGRDSPFVSPANANETARISGEQLTDARWGHTQGLGGLSHRVTGV
jgi:hypothetical protein